MWRRTFVAIAVGATLSLAAGGSSAGAAGDDPGWWYDAIGVGAARDAGLTGAGVKVAVIDTQMYTDVPAFAGADVTVDSSFVCSGGVAVPDVPNEDATHGMAVTGMLVARDSVGPEVRSVSPDASVTVYTVGGSDVCRSSVAADATAKIVDAAVDAGNRVISTSISYTSMSEDMEEAVARAIAAGVVIVTSRPNRLADAASLFPGSYNGVVSVAATDIDRELQKDDDGTTPVVIPDTVVVAPGVDVGTVGPPGDDGSPWDTLSVSNGSSMSAPIVAGVLALGAQKWPEVSGNQLIAALLHSTRASQKGYEPSATDGSGWGLVDVPAFLASDPGSYPDVNPLMGKPFGKPTQAEMDELSGKAPVGSGEPAPTASSSEGSGSASSDGGGVPVVPLLVGGVVVLVAVGVVTAVVVSRRRRATSEAPMRAPVPNGLPDPAQAQRWTQGQPHAGPPRPQHGAPPHAPGQSGSAQRPPQPGAWKGG